MAAVHRVRKVQEDIAAASRLAAERVVAEEEARFAARQTDVVTPWSERAVVELAYESAARAKESLASAASTAAERRRVHVDAVRAAKAIEKLVERRRAEVAREELRDQAAQLDDLASIRHARKVAGR
jgi:hypothetical protein